MRRRNPPSHAWMVIFCSIFSSPAIAQEDDTSQLSGDASDRLRAEAAAYEFRSLESGKGLDLHPQALLHWSNPVRRGEDGMVFVWTDGREPCAVGTFFTYPHDDEVRRKHEFHVLSNRAIQARNKDRVIWSPPNDAVEYHPLAKAPPPASTRAQRTAHLRLLARQFSVRVTHQDGRKDQCRLVPQPLYKFDSDAADGPAGAIFAFALGTDPEALLILNRQLDVKGKARWHYAMARFTFYPLEGFLNRKQVWSVEKAENLKSSILQRPDYQRNPYIIFSDEWLD